jgi:hypothetical protein
MKSAYFGSMSKNHPDYEIPQHHSEYKDQNMKTNKHINFREVNRACQLHIQRPLIPLLGRYIYNTHNYSEWATPY